MIALAKSKILSVTWLGVHHVGREHEQRNGDEDVGVGQAVAHGVDHRAEADPLRQEVRDRADQHAEADGHAQHEREDQEQRTVSRGTSSYQRILLFGVVGLHVRLVPERLDVEHQAVRPTGRSVETIMIGSDEKMNRSGIFMIDVTAGVCPEAHGWSTEARPRGTRSR